MKNSTLRKADWLAVKQINPDSNMRADTFPVKNPEYFYF